MSLVIERFVTTGFGWKTPAPNSQKSYRNHISQFEAFLKDRNKAAPDGTVTDQDIADYIEHLKGKYQQNTVAVKIAAIKSYFKFLKKEGTLAFHPQIRSQKNIKPKHYELDASDIVAITKAMTASEGNLYNQRDLAMFFLVVYCGFKTSEVATINVGDVDFETGVITVGKKNRPFRAALSEMVAYRTGKFAHWQSHPKVHVHDNSNDPFFLNKHSGRISTRSIRRRLLKKSPSHTMRDLRHTYLKNLDKMNADLVGV